MTGRSSRALDRRHRGRLRGVPHRRPLQPKLRRSSSLVDLGGRSRGMKHMLDYLIAHPEKGLLGYQMAAARSSSTGGPSNSSRRSPRTRTIPTCKPWRDYWRRVGKSGAHRDLARDVPRPCGEYEAIYGNMPPYGLGKATSLVPVADSVTARQRLEGGVAVAAGAGVAIVVGAVLGAVSQNRPR